MFILQNKLKNRRGEINNKIVDKREYFVSLVSFGEKKGEEVGIRDESKTKTTVNQNHKSDELEKEVDLESTKQNVEEGNGEEIKRVIENVVGNPVVFLPQPSNVQ